MLPKVGNFCLKNSGGFTVKLQFMSWDQGGHKNHVDGTGAYPLGQTECRTPGQSGVPDGSPVSLYAFVVWGNDNEAKQMFTYDASSTVTANYTISGTTLNNDLVLDSVQ